MQLEPFFTLPLIFGLTLLVSGVIYVMGRFVSAKERKSELKGMPYACGEDLSPQKFQVNLNEFLIYAVYFLVFDILVFTIATSFRNPGNLPVFYLVIVMEAIIILIPVLRRQ